MSTTQQNPEKGLTKSGPFSPDRYNGDNALEVGLPSPEAMNLLVLFSQQMVGTPFVPKALSNGPNPAGNILAVILTGREEGFSPMEALRSYWVSPDGRLAKYANALMAKMRRAGFKFPVQSFSDTKAILKGVRPDGEEYESQFTIEEAKRAGLTGKDIWQKYPQRMLKARVIGDVYNFLAADLGGPAYTAEEIQDIDDSHANAIDPATDQQRMNVLAAQEEKYAVKLKQSSAEVKTIEVQPEVKAEPKQEAAPALPKAAPAPQPEPQEATPDSEPTYEIHVLMATAGKGKPKPIRCEQVPPQKNIQAAGLMAQSMANDSGMEHVIIEVIGNERSQMGGAYKPPTKMAPKPTPAPTAPEQEEPKPEPTAQAHPTTEATAAAEPVIDPMARLNKLAEFIGLPGKTAMARFQAYMSGFLGCRTKEEFKGQPNEDRLKALASLEYTIYADANEFQAGPEVSGQRHRKWLDETTEFLTTLWPKPEDRQCVDLALQLFQKRGNTPKQFRDWTELDGIDLAFRPMEDVYAVLRVLMKTREGVVLLTVAKAHNLSVAKAVDMIETRGLKCSIEQADPKAIEAAIAGYQQAVRDTARQQQAAPPPEKAADPAPAPEEDEDADGEGLFGSDY